MPLSVLHRVSSDKENDLIVINRVKSEFKAHPHPTTMVNSTQKGYIRLPDVENDSSESSPESTPRIIHSIPRSPLKANLDSIIPQDSRNMDPIQFESNLSRQAITEKLLNGHIVSLMDEENHPHDDNTIVPAPANDTLIIIDTPQPQDATNQSVPSNSQRHSSDLVISINPDGHRNELIENSTVDGPNQGISTPSKGKQHPVMGRLEQNRTGSFSSIRNLEKTELALKTDDHFLIRQTIIKSPNVSPMRYPPNPLRPAVPVVSDDEYVAIIESVRRAISKGILPSRIGQGSSGSYFCRNENGEIVGVFKPKNEEPYGHLNPKWTKWIHRNFFWCCFGRSCLIPNLGYVSEAAASLLDRRLGFNIVPRTEIVSLSAPSFHYSRTDIKKALGKGALSYLPPKIGSFQLFLNGFKDATVFMRDNPLPPLEILEHTIHTVLTPSQQNGDRQNGSVDQQSAHIGMISPSSNTSSNSNIPSSSPFNRETTSDNINSAPSILNTPSPSSSSPSSPTHLPHRTQSASSGGSGGRGSGRNNRKSIESISLIWSFPLQLEFLEHFQRLVILDYIMRNTDRGLDNWMVKFTEGGVEMNDSERVEVRTDEEAITENGELLRTEQVVYQCPEVNIAGIDHGLAFPFKHPDKWRAYPYGWLALPVAQIPFLPSIRDYILPLLTSSAWLSETQSELYRLFAIDSDFDIDMFERQIAVVRGQIWNIVETFGKYGDRASPVLLVQRPPVAIYEEEELFEIVDDEEFESDSADEEGEGETDESDDNVEADDQTHQSSHPSHSSHRPHHPKSRQLPTSYPHHHRESRKTSTAATIQTFWEQSKKKVKKGRRKAKKGLNKARQKIMARVKRILVFTKGRPWFQNW